MDIGRRQKIIREHTRVAAIAAAVAGLGVIFMGVGGFFTYVFAGHANIATAFFTLAILGMFATGFGTYIAIKEWRFVHEVEEW